MDIDGLNIWAVVVAWFITCAVGAFWYSPAGFARQWKQHTGIDILKIPPTEASKILGFVVLSGLVQVLTLAVVINSLGITTAAHGLVAGLTLWLGLTAATTVGVTLYSRRSWKFWWLNSSYFLVVMAINAVMLAIWH